MEKLIKFDAGMYFAFSTLARPGLKAKTCFEAIVNGERTSTTRFEADSYAQFHKWKSLKPGDIVRVWSKRWNKGLGKFGGDSLLIEITKNPKEIDLETIDREEWSLVEGWSSKWIDHHINTGESLKGIQIRYTMVEGSLTHETLPSDGQGTLTLNP